MLAVSERGTQVFHPILYKVKKQQQNIEINDKQQNKNTNDV